MKSPTVSVVLPAYDAEEWLPEAVRSIVQQSFKDFELLIIDDGSTRPVSESLVGFGDGRVRVVRQDPNKGLIASLNHGFDVAAGRFIARMDADDVAYPQRLARQVDFLEAHPEVGICGSWFRLARPRWKSVVRPPVGHDDISARLFFRSPFGHPTVMFNRKFLDSSGLRYDSAAQHAEDFDLWERSRHGTRFANLPEVLLEYRVHESQVSKHHAAMQRQATARIRLKQLATLLPAASADEQALHLKVCEPAVFSSHDELLQARHWLDHLGDANRRVRLFPASAFSKALGNAWDYCCLKAAMAPPQVLATYFSRNYAGFALQAVRTQGFVASKICLRPLIG